MQYNFLTAVLALVTSAGAFPSFPDFDSRAINPKTEPNSGFFPNVGFDAKDQFVDVGPGSGHEFRAPRPTDIRGPCPGLNAAANHGFIDRSGVINLEDTTAGLAKAFNFGYDFSLPLFFFSVFNSGSLLDENWSIGGSYQTTTIGLLGNGEGISNSHGKYEGDSSPGRGDAYLHHGDAHSLVMSNYDRLYNAAENGRFNFRILRQHAIDGHQYTIKNNPYGFFGPGFFVSPIAHQFILAMMSNHSESEVQGYLDQDLLNSFFSVKKNSKGENYWVPGHEHIPRNWYKRPSSNMYGIVASFADFGLSIKEYPGFLDIGGNNGKPDTFAGLEIENLSGGVFNSKNILKGNNLACFAMQGTTFGIPEQAQNITNSLLKLLTKTVDQTKLKLGCPQLTKYSNKAFERYPGYTRKLPEQPGTPY